MSTFAFAKLTNERIEADPDKPEENKQGKDKLVDALVAIIPAEALAVHSIGFGLTSKVVESGDPDVNQVSYEIIHVLGLQCTFYGGLLITVLVGILGFRHLKGNRSRFLRLLIAPTAFILWMMLLPVSALDAVLPGFDGTLQQVLGAIGAVVLMIITSAFAERASQATSQ